MNLHALLAEAIGPQGRLQAMQRHLRERDEDPTIWWGLLLVLGVGVLLYLGLYTVQRMQNDRGSEHLRSAGRLFQEVMQKLDLPFPDRVLLRRIARGLALKNPAAMLVSPSTLRWAAGEWSRHRLARGAGHTEDVQRLVAISTRVFGRPFDAVDPNAPSEAGPMSDRMDESADDDTVES